MTIAKRQIINERRTGAMQLTNEIKLVEQSTHAVATWIGHFTGVLLDFHQKAALPPSAGMNAIALLGKMQADATSLCMDGGRLHDMLKEVADQNGIELAGLPDCDENKPARIFTMP